MAKRNARALRTWLDNCGGFTPRHDLAELRRGIAVGFLNEQDEWGMTALMLAASDGWLDGVQVLLDAQADTELRYFRTGETALRIALHEPKRNQPVIAALLAAGASPDAANYWGLTPRMWAAHGTPPSPFDAIPVQPVQMPAPRIQNAEHLADHYYPRFKIPGREEREAMTVGRAVILYVYGPQSEVKQDAVKVRVTARAGRRPNVRYTAVLETPVEQTHLPADTTEARFGPENIATVFVPRPVKKGKKK